MITCLQVFRLEPEDSIRVRPGRVDGQLELCIADLCIWATPEQLRKLADAIRRDVPLGSADTDEEAA